MSDISYLADLISEDDDGSPGEFEELPNGPYSARPERCEPRPNNNGGWRLATMFRVTAGPLAGRTIWRGFNLPGPDGKGEFYFKRDVMAGLGVSAHLLREAAVQQNLQLVADDIVARAPEVTITVGPGRLYQGRVPQEVKSVAPLDAAEGVPPVPTAPAGTVPTAPAGTSTPPATPAPAPSTTPAPSPTPAASTPPSEQPAQAPAPASAPTEQAAEGSVPPPPPPPQPGF